MNNFPEDLISLINQFWWDGEMVQQLRAQGPLRVKGPQFSFQCPYQVAHTHL